MITHTLGADAVCVRVSGSINMPASMLICMCEQLEHAAPELHIVSVRVVLTYIHA
jgi:hypothetical protein